MYGSLLVFYCLITAFFVSPSPAVPSTCPSTCKCDPILTNQTTDGHVTRPGSLIANCWIPANLPQLACGSNWDVLHLQILAGQSTKQDSSFVRNIDVNQPDQITVTPTLFAACESITKLAIWERSQFTQLSEYILRPLINLERLFIQVPTLTTLPDHFLAFLPKVNFVTVSNCRQLWEIGRSVFEPCPSNLQTLWLHGNRIRGRLAAGLFHQCNLKTLWLNDNQIEQLDWGCFRGLKSLTHLRLNQNSLEGSLSDILGYRDDMSSSALRDVPLLKIIDLSANRISSINDYKWSNLCNTIEDHTEGLCSLEELNLSKNKIQWISPDAFRGLPNLRKLRLDGNAQLITSDSGANLALTLYGLSVTCRRLVQATIPRFNKDTGSSGETSSVAERDLLNVCNMDDKNTYTRLPVSLKYAISTLKNQSCNAKFEQTKVVETIRQPNTSRVMAKSVNTFQNRSVPTRAQKGTMQKFGNFLRNSDHLLLLILIGFGLVIGGVILGFLPYLCVYCSSKRRKSRQKLSSSTFYPATMPGAKQDGYFLTQNGIQLIPPSPLPTRVTDKMSRNSVLWPAVPVRHPQNGDVNNRSSEVILGGPIITLTPSRTRRVNSTGNVGRRGNLQGARCPSRQFVQDQAAPMQFHPLMVPTRQSPLFHHMPVDLRPLLQPCSDTQVGSVYSPTIETSMGGGESTYSLATLNPCRTHASVEPTNNGPLWIQNSPR